jgi:hypothetical protein
MTSQLAPQDLYGFVRRAAAIRVDIDTTADPEDLTDIVFRVADQIEVTGLSASGGGDGLLVDLTLTATHLDIWPGTYRWELSATVSSQTRTIAHGWLIVDPEPTEESSS